MAIHLNTSFHCAEALAPRLEEWLKAYANQNKHLSPKTFRIITEVAEGACAYALQTLHLNAEDAQGCDDSRQAEFLASFGADVQAGRIVAFSSLLEPIE